MDQLQLSNFAQSNGLKEVGFDWGTNNLFRQDIHSKKWEEEYDPSPWNNNFHNFTISRPTVAHALMWLRDVKEVHVSVNPLEEGYWGIVIYGIKAKTVRKCGSISDRPFTTHDAAQMEGLNIAIGMCRANLGL